MSVMFGLRSGWNNRSASGRIRTLIMIGLGCFLITSAPTTAKPLPSDDACLHIFTRDSFDYEYNITTNIWRKVPRLPGVSDRVLLSTDEQRFSLEGEIGDRPYFDDSELPYGSRYRAALYVGPTTKGKVVLPATQRPTYVDEEVIIGSTAWSPDSSRLAYLDTVDSQNRLGITLYDPRSGEKTHSKDPILNVASQLLGWSADGTYVAVADVDLSKNGSLVLFSTDTLKAQIIPGMVSGTEYQNWFWRGFEHAFSWSPRGHDAAYIRQSPVSSNSEMVVITAGESPRVQPLSEMKISAIKKIVWSPDGRLVGVYYQKQDGFDGLQVFEVDGAVIAPRSGAVDVTWSYWSKDSQWLLYFTGTDLKRLWLADGTVETVITGVKTWDYAVEFPYFPYHLHPQTQHLIVPYSLPDGRSGIDVLSLSDLSRRTLHQDAGEVLIVWSPDRAYFLGIWEAPGSSEARNPNTPTTLLWASAEGEVQDQFEITGFTYQKWFDQTSTEYGVYNMGWLDSGRKLALVTPQPKDDQVLWQVSIYHGGGKHTSIAKGLHDVSLSSEDLEGDLLQFTWRDQNGRQHIDAYTPDGQIAFQYRMDSAPPDSTDRLESPYYVRRSPAGGKAALISAFPAEWGRESKLYWIDGDQIRPNNIKPSTAYGYGTPTGLLWAPDGAYLASYYADSLELPNAFGSVSLFPGTSTIDIYDSEGVMIRHLDSYRLGSRQWASFMWTHCDTLASDPYTRESLLLRYYIIRGWD